MRQREGIKTRGEGSRSLVNKGNKHRIQRALIFQGGGALAAYEVGAYAALYFWIKKDLFKENRKGEETNKNNNNIFDVIAGTSGGAINASIIVSHVLEKRKQKFDIEDSWSGTLKRLLDFWNHISSDPDYNKWGPYSIFGEIVQEPFLFAPESSLMPLNYYRWKWPPDESTWKSRWDKAHTIDKYVANGESARRYYSAKEYLYTGAENVFRRSATEHDNRFFDDFVAPTNTWYHYDNTPLRKSIERYVTFPMELHHFLKKKERRSKRNCSLDY